MLDVNQNNTNISLGTGNKGFAIPVGVYNEFATSEVDNGESGDRDIIRLFLLVVFILTIMLAVASYVYTNYLDSQIEAKKASLANIDNNPNIDVFEKSLPKMREFSKKIKLFNTVNNSSIYLSGVLFPILESVVESSGNSYVYFNNINIRKGGQGTLMNVSITGVAQGYLALSRQITNFKSGPLSSHFLNFKFLHFQLNAENQVDFSISFDIDVSTVSYLDLLKMTYGVVPTQKNVSGVLFKSNAPANIFSTDSSTSSATSSSGISTTTPKKVKR